MTGHTARPIRLARQRNPKRRLPKLYADIWGQILSTGAASMLITAPVNAAETKSTLLSGEFGDERLIIAADPDNNSPSGYYRDGECRVFMVGKLEPFTQNQRADLGESYEVQSWEPG